MSGIILQRIRPSLTTKVEQCQVRSITYLKPPTMNRSFRKPEDPRPKAVPKVPVIPNNHKPAKMQRMINLMRFPEQVHNTLIYKQYGMQVTRGGRLKAENFEEITNVINEKLDFKRQFFVWRVDSPWQSCTKRPIGFTLGGGKGNIHHFVTPVAPDRIIFEIAGNCTYEEAVDVINVLCQNKKAIPFKARPVSYEGMMKEKEQEKIDADRNMNPYTWEYLIKNNMLGCRKYVKRIDYHHFGKYL